MLFQMARLEGRSLAEIMLRGVVFIKKSWFFWISHQNFANPPSYNQQEECPSNPNFFLGDFECRDLRKIVWYAVHLCGEFGGRSKWSGPVLDSLPETGPLHFGHPARELCATSMDKNVFFVFFMIKCFYKPKFVGFACLFRDLIFFQKKLASPTFAGIL